MSDALGRFISGLKNLDPTNLNAPANQAAMQKFQSLPNTEQRDVLNGLAGKFGATFDELDALSPTDKQRVTENVRAGREAFDGVTRVQQQQNDAPKSFNEKWLAAAEAARSDKSSQQEAYASSHADFAKQHGTEAARSRHGFVNPAREAQLSRIADMQAEAKRTGKTFSEVADARVAAGQ